MPRLFGAACGVGTRDRNEDFVSVDEEIGLYLVVDAHGSREPAHETLQRTVCSVLPASLRIRRATRSGVLDGADLVDAMAEMSTELFHALATDPTGAGTGATIAVLLAQEDDDTAWVAFIGDCRAFLVHDGRARSLYEPHTFVAEQLRAGRITTEEAAVSPHNNILTRCLGFSANERPDIVEIAPTDPGDVVLVSDGVLEILTPDELALLCHVSNADRAAAAIVKRASTSSDNVSAVVVSRRRR